MKTLVDYLDIYTEKLMIFKNDLLHLQNIMGATVESKKAENFINALDELKQVVENFPVCN